MAEAMAWVARITNISLEMVVPGILGTLLDKRWNTSHWGPVGFFLGLVVAVYHLLAITRQAPINKQRPKPSNQPPGDRPDQQPHDQQPHDQQPHDQPPVAPRGPARSDATSETEVPPETPSPPETRLPPKNSPPKN